MQIQQHRHMIQPFVVGRQCLRQVVELSEGSVVVEFLGIGFLGQQDPEGFAPKTPDICNG